MSWPCRGLNRGEERMEYRHPLYQPEDEYEHCRRCEYHDQCDYAPLREDQCEVYGIRELYG